MSLLSKLAGTTDARKALITNMLDHNGWTIDTDGFMTPPWALTTTVSANEEYDETFQSYVEGGYKANGIIFACIQARSLPFSEARFQFQRIADGRPGDLFSGSDLGLLENPWPNGTTGELLARMEQDASLAGNFYATVVGEGADRRIRRLRPDWVTIISGIRGRSNGDPYSLNGEVLGYVYDPGRTGDNSVLLMPDQVAHYSPIPDPVAQWRGMSWLTPIIREVTADSATTLHKLKFFENGGTPSYVIKYDASISPDAFRRYVDLFNEQHRGVNNAYKILHIGGGADPTSVGANLQQLDFKATQGAGETRIAAAARVHPVIVGLSEGMAGSSLNAGNYAAAKRQFADMTIRPLWRLAAGALANLITVPSDARLWYDSRDVAFLKEDEKDSAAIQSQQATTIVSLTNAGFTPDSVIAAVQTGDFKLLQDSGLRSVQLQAAGVDEAASTDLTAAAPTIATAEQANALGVLIRAGVEPATAARAVGITGLTFTGAVPVSLRVPEADAAVLEAT